MPFVLNIMLTIRRLLRGERAHKFVHRLVIGLLGKPEDRGREILVHIVGRGDAVLSLHQYEHSCCQSALSKPRPRDFVVCGLDGRNAHPS